VAADFGRLTQRRSNPSIIKSLSVRHLSSIFIVFLLPCFIFSTSALAGITIYVNAACGDDARAGADPNCLDPNGPKATIQAAIDAANDGDTIIVAEGIYYPTAEVGGTGERYKTFQMKNGVAIYGGFRSGGTWQGRDPANYITILSGDIGTPIDNSDNCYHVFYHPAGTDLDSTAILDGITITAGNANGSGAHTDGGAMCNFSSSPTITNCTFSGNSADYRGGGMCNYSSSPTVTDCTFSGNSGDYRGGGMFNFSNSDPTITNCTFSGNSAGDGGGGMYNYSCRAIVSNCTFSYNEAYDGGGMDNNYSSNSIVTNCTFSDNSSEHRGGGIYNDSGNLTITNCIVSGNSANFGGGMYNFASSPVLTNCTFSGNSSVGRGGGMRNYYAQSDPTLSNCIFWGNFAPGGAQIYNEEFLGQHSLITVNYSDVQGGWPGIDNIDVDPCFVDPAYWDPNGTKDDPNDDFWVDGSGDFHLSVGSFCVDAGDPCFVPAPGETDIDGDPRVINLREDMGADEFRHNPDCWFCRTQCHGDANCDYFVNTDDWPTYRD